jgi:hypothetical protein
VTTGVLYGDESQCFELINQLNCLDFMQPLLLEEIDIVDEELLNVSHWSIHFIYEQFIWLFEYLHSKHRKSESMSLFVISYNSVAN